MTEEAPKLKVKKEVLGKAIRALHQIVAKRASGTNQLFDSSTETMTLLVTLSQVPDKRRMRPVMIPLPHPMYDEKSEICFFSKDPQKKYKEMLLKEHHVPGVTKVIGIDKLRRNYKTIEAKRALADAFDLFLCDRNVAEMMPSILGAVFYRKKHKVPVPVQLMTDPKPQIERAIKGTPMRIPTGPCIGIKFGRCNMSEEDLLANATAVIKGVVKNVLRNPIQSISVQATDVPALPVWRRPAPPGTRVNLKKEYSDATSSSAASDTAASGASETEGTEYGSLPSDAGETLSTRDTVSEAETSDFYSLDPELDSEAGDVDVDTSGDLPLLRGLAGKKRKGGAGAPKESPKQSPQASPKKAPKGSQKASPKASPKPEPVASMPPPMKKAAEKPEPAASMPPPAKKAKKAKA